MDTPAYQAAAEMLTAGEFKSGQTVTHYKIVSLKGGMGTVYPDEDTKLHRKVSLKVLSTKFMQDHERCAGLNGKRALLSALNHPNILTIHEISEIDGRRFIATEFIESKTLRGRLASDLNLDDAPCRGRSFLRSDAFI